MADPPCTEAQIDCFLEQFKLTASKVMEESTNVIRSRSSYLDNDMTDDNETSFEEIEMQNSMHLEPIGVHDVAEILQPQYAIITGGKSKEGCPLITFPDQNNFHTLSDVEYQRLMLYLTSVPSLQDADLGFHLIIDRRKDRWNSVKTVLLKISVYFPGLIHVVYVVRPASFLQKALSEMSNKLFKEEFKFRMIVVSTAEELHEHIDVSQLTADLGGTLQYCHQEWIQQREALEKFSAKTHEVSHALDIFTKNINETEFPNNVDSTQHLLNQQTLAYSELKEEILAAAKHGESLLWSIKETSVPVIDSSFGHSPDMIGNVFAVERLLVQLEETERTFDEFWQQHSTKLRHCLELRRFEQDFRELQINFDSHLKTVSEMIEIGETVQRVDTLIKETATFQKLCMVDVERAEEVISSGQQLLKIRNSCPLECVEPKCNELLRVREILTERLCKRMDTLLKCRDLMEQLDQANRWCTRGVDLLTSQGLEKSSSSVKAAEIALESIEEFIASADEYKINSPKKFRSVLQDPITPETKALVTQVLQRIEDVSCMCAKRISNLKNVITKPALPVQTVTPEPAVPRQPSIGAPQPHKSVLKKTNTIPKMESTKQDGEIIEPSISPEIDVSQDEIHKVKQGHILAELLETERAYVSELSSLLTGYKKEVLAVENRHLLPPGLLDKVDILFGNLDELYRFHDDVFLRDLENCISSIELVALCFVQRKDLFFRLYSYYCQNIPRSEQLRVTLTDPNMFLQTCQKKLGHKLPLGAYLLKPVQRITKYQLLLKDLLRSCDEGKCYKELEQALDSMLVVLKCVNDSMLQMSITGFPVDLAQQGDLLLQGLYSVWTENKKDLRLRIKPVRRQIFLYQKAILFCKPTTKTGHNNQMFQFKHHLKMSQVGLTETVKGDQRKFEVWLQGRQEVHTIQTSNPEQKQEWVRNIKQVLFDQLEELKGEKIRQYKASGIAYKQLTQTASWGKSKSVPNSMETPHRTISCDAESRLSQNLEDEVMDTLESWSSDCSNSDDEDPNSSGNPSGRYLALEDYCAVGSSEISMKEGDILELLKVGCAGWWYVKVIGSTAEGWAPAAYLENLHRKVSQGGCRSQDRLNDH